MADIHSVMAENRRGKKERKKKPQDENIMSASATHGSHKYKVYTNTYLGGVTRSAL